MRTVLVTGAGSGLGRALIDVFAKNGWEAVAASHSDLDVADEKSIETFVADLKGKPIDVLINCAGVYDSPPGDETVVSTIPNIIKIFQVNTIGTRVLTDSLLPNLQKGNEKLVVTISSEMGTYDKLDEYNAKHWPYSASKIAVNYAMLAFNRAHPKMKCVLIHPGWMKTKLGGVNAPLEPSFSAEKIFELIKNHKRSLVNGKIVDYEGKLIGF